MLIDQVARLFGHRGFLIIPILEQVEHQMATLCLMFEANRELLIRFVR